MPFAQVIPVTGPNFGVPGNLSRLGDPLTVSKPVLNSTPDTILFGQAVVVIPETAAPGDAVVSAFDYILATAQGGQGGTFTAAKFGGIAVREVKTNLVFPENPDVPASAGYAPGQDCGFAVRGTVSVYVQNGTPASQGTVYIRKTYNPAFPNGVVGGFEAAVSDSGTNCVALSQVVWKTGQLDANNIAEVTILERSAA